MVVRSCFELPRHSHDKSGASKLRLRNSRRAATCVLDVSSSAPRGALMNGPAITIFGSGAFSTKYNGKGSEYYCEYDPGCPDEREPTNHPLILLADDPVIGTIRIDLKLQQGIAVFRLVAIDDPWRRQGLGTIMLNMAERYARRCGIR